MTIPMGRTPVSAAIALILATALPVQAYAAEATPNLADLQAENARLRQEIESLKRERTQAATVAAPASAAGTVPSNQVAAGNGTAQPALPAEPTAAGATTAAAPVEEQSLDTVVITSRNREEIAQNVPLPVQVLGGAQLERDGVQSVWDLAGKAPNLRLNPPGENARKVSVSIRGVGRNGANDSAEGSVGVIVDGVSLYYAGQAWNDYVDLDRIEVLRGPQGTLMGKNTTLGAVNIVTKGPSFTPASSFELGTGNLNSINGKFSSTGPLVDGVLAYRGTVVVDRANGLYTNTYQSMGRSKETWNEVNKVAGRFQLLFTPTADLSARVILDKLRSDERTNLGFQSWNGPAVWSDGTPRATITPAAGYTGSAANYGYLGKFAQRAVWFHNPDGSYYQPRLGTTAFGNSEARPQITNQHGLSAQVDWKLQDHTLTSITAHRYQDFDIKNGGNYDQFYITNSGQQLWNRQFSQELRLSSTPAAGKAFDYQLGLYYLDARVYSDDPSYYGPDAGAWLASGGQYNSLIGSAAGRELLRASLDGVYQSSVTDARVKSVALYGQTDWHLTEQATLSLGARVTKERKTNRLSQQVDRSGADLAALQASNGATGAQLSAAQAIRAANLKTPFDFVDGKPIDDVLVAWNVGPSYKLTDDVLLYSSLGAGVKSGVVSWRPTRTSDTAPVSENLDPEKSLDFELGFKSLLLDRRLQLNLNFYNTRIKDYQTQIQVPDSSSSTGYSNLWRNADGVRARGIELESAYKVSSALNLSFTGAYNLARYDGEFLVARPEVNPDNYPGRSGLVDLDGKQLHNAPKLTLNLTANYQQPIWGYLGRITVNSSFTGGAYLNVNQADYTWQGGYNLVNIGLGLGSLDRRYEVSLIGKNVLDKDYATSRSTYTNTNAATEQIGAPRWWGLVFRAKL